MFSFIVWNIFRVSFPIIFALSVAWSRVTVLKRIKTSINKETVSQILKTAKILYLFQRGPQIQVAKFISKGRSRNTEAARRDVSIRTVSAMCEQLSISGCPHYITLILTLRNREISGRMYISLPDYGNDVQSIDLFMRNHRGTSYW